MKSLLALVLLAGCSTSDSLGALDELVLSATTGGEESVVGSDDSLSPAAIPAGERPDPFRTCDASGTYQDLFDHYDSDGDGKLDVPEEEDVMAARGERGPGEDGMIRAQWALLVTIYDTDGDGAIGDSERATLFEDFTARCSAIQAMLIEDFDTDGDGVLSDEEQDAARAAIEEDMASHRPPEPPPEGEMGEGPPSGAPPVPPPLLDEFDADDDGALSATELETLRSTMRERIRAGHPLCGL